MLRLLAILILTSSLTAGCSSGPAYRPFDGNIGYSEAEIRPGVFIVSYDGFVDMSDGQAIETAKIRAAELAMSRGKTHFRIRDNTIRSKTETDVSRDWITVDRFNDDGRRFYSDRHAIVTDVRVNARPSVLLTVELLDESADGEFEAAAVYNEAAVTGLIAPELALPTSRPADD